MTCILDSYASFLHKSSHVRSAAHCWTLLMELQHVHSYLERNCCAGSLLAYARGCSTTNRCMSSALASTRPSAEWCAPATEFLRARCESCPVVHTKLQCLLRLRSVGAHDQLLPRSRLTQ